MEGDDMIRLWWQQHGYCIGDGRMHKGSNQRWLLSLANTTTLSATKRPTSAPANTTTLSATKRPTSAPANTTTLSATKRPTSAPANTTTLSETKRPTSAPANTTTLSATKRPTSAPANTTTLSATKRPTSAPANTTTLSATKRPTSAPANTTALSETKRPTSAPANTTTLSATKRPTSSPANTTTLSATKRPTSAPANTTTLSATKRPTSAPANTTALSATKRPTSAPANTTTLSATKGPTSSPANTTTLSATKRPTSAPANTTTLSETKRPTSAPANTTTLSATKRPTSAPANTTTLSAPKRPTSAPANTTTLSATKRPTSAPANTTTLSATKRPTSKSGGNATGKNSNNMQARSPRNKNDKEMSCSGNKNMTKQTNPISISYTSASQTRKKKTPKSLITTSNKTNSIINEKVRKPLIGGGKPGNLICGQKETKDSNQNIKDSSEESSDIYIRQGSKTIVNESAKSCEKDNELKNVIPESSNGKCNNEINTNQPLSNKDKQTKEFSSETSQCQNEEDKICEDLQEGSNSEQGIGAAEKQSNEMNESTSINDFLYYENKLKFLSQQEAITFVIENTDKTVDELPYQPKANTFFIYSAGCQKEKADDWKADGYRWKQYGTKQKDILLEDKEVTVLKKFFRITNGTVHNDKFQKQVFLFKTDHDISNHILIMYYGDESVYEPAPHGSSKNKNNFVSTKKSVLQIIRNENNHNPVQVRNKILGKINTESTNANATVRNIKQVKNVQYAERSKDKISHDSLYNLTVLHYHLVDYISDIKIIPDLYVFCGLTEAFAQFDKLLQLKSEESVCLFYDTTFELGNFYVSTISYQHYLFKENPVIPLAHLIHERKFQKTHEDFLQYVKNKVPRLGKLNIPIVTDREQGLINAIKNVFPNMTNLLCWNHILRDIKDWLRKKGETNENIQVYVKQIRSLLEAEDEASYLFKLNNVENGYRNLWSQLFVEHFDKNLESELKSSAVRWVVSEFDQYNPYSGITNNASESNNARVKRLLNFKEHDIDTIVLYFYYFQLIDHNNILKGLCKLGEYSVKGKFEKMTVSPDEIELLKVVNPEEIIDLLRGTLSTETNKVEQFHSPLKDETDEHDKIDEDDTKREFTTKSKILSQESLANKVICDKGVTLVPEVGAFLVKGNRNQLYAVKLFPEESCQCPSSTRCYHIIAAMRSIGMKKNERKRVVSLSKLRKNSRKNNQKRLGRKKPRLGDIDLNESVVNPAPDSLSASMADLSHASENDTDLMSPVKEKSQLRTSTPNQETPRSILKQKRKVTLPDIQNSKKKLRFSSQDNIEDLIESSNDERNECDSRQTKSEWLPNLFLDKSDKDLISNDMKLTSNHMEAINIISRQQFAEKINGFQLPERVRIEDRKKKTS